MTGVAKGQYVKIRRNGERFWVKLTKTTGPWLSGKLANDLVTQKGKFGDKIHFRKSEIIEIK